MREIELKYGVNPNQVPARIYVEGGDLPLAVLSGRPGYINFLDALNGWQLVRELKRATALPAAASFKHISPAGAAVGIPLSEKLRRMYFIAPEAPLSPLAAAYARARGSDRVSSFGDFVALSDICDLETANLLAKEVSDGVIAPGYAPEALEILKSKRKGNYTVLQIAEGYIPAALERRMCYGITFEQGRNALELDESMLQNIVTANKHIPAEARRDLLIALIVLKYTQSNSVCYAQDGQTIGVGAGQQSRIHCTRLAGNKADLWQLRRHPKALALPFLPTLSRAERDNAIDLYLGNDFEDVWQRCFSARPEPLSESERREHLAQVSGVSLGSDAFFPFGDNVERAQKSGVSYIAQPGGSIRDDHVIAACDRHGIAMAFTGIRLFHH